MLDKEFEALPLKQVPDLPVSALSILPPEGELHPLLFFKCDMQRTKGRLDAGVEVLHKINIRTIKHLGKLVT